jgi:hypothetical protein
VTYLPVPLGGPSGPERADRDGVPDELVEWVDTWLVPTFRLAPGVLQPCWLQHPDVVDYLLSAWLARRAAEASAGLGDDAVDTGEEAGEAGTDEPAGPRPTGRLVAWHDEWDRMIERVRRAMSACSWDRHDQFPAVEFRTERP